MNIMKKEETIHRKKQYGPSFSSDVNETEQKMRLLWEECQPAPMDASRIWTKTAEKIRKAEVQADRPGVRRQRRRLWQYLGGAVAMLALLLGGLAWWQHGSPLSFEKQKSMVETICLNNADGVRLVILPDSSRMWVNVGSKVSYPSAFTGDRREISVEGEVYLEVTRKANFPFVVHAPGFEVEVLGTSFDVSAYRGVQHAVTLLEGSVRVEDEYQKSVFLQPDERLEVSEAGLGKKETVDARSYTRWVRKIWLLEGKPLHEVLDELGVYYNVTIGCDSAVADEPFYGKLYVGGDVHQALEAIRQTLPDEGVRAGKEMIYIR